MRDPNNSTPTRAAVRPKHQGGLSFGYFSLTTQRKVTRYQAKSKLKKKKKLSGIR
jgi:hypothetical protein